MSQTPAGLNPSELSALEVGTNMYRAAVSQELGVFLGGLGIDSSQVDAATTAISDRARDLSLLDAKEAAESMQRIRHLLGTTVATSVEVDAASTIEPATAETANTPEPTTVEVAVSYDPEDDDSLRLFEIDPSGQIVQPEPLSETPEEPTETVEVIPPEPISAKSVTAMIHFFGEENRELLEQLTVSNSEAIVGAIIDTLARNKMIFRTQADLRHEQFTRRIFEGVSWTSLGAEGPSAQTTFSRSGIKMRTQMSSEERAEIIRSVLGDNPEQIPVAPIAAAERAGVATTEQPTVDAQEQEHNSEVDTPNLQRLRKVVGDFLGRHIEGDLSTMSAEELQSRLDAALELISQYNPRIQKTLPQRRADIAAYIGGETWTKISKAQGKSATYAQVAFRYLRGAYATALNAHSAGVEPPTRPEPVAEVLDGVTPANSEPSHEEQVDNDQTSFQKLGQAIGRSEETEIALLESLFDPSRFQPDYSDDARSVYDDIAMALELISTSKTHGTFATTLEYRVFNLMARGANDGGPLPPRSVQSRVSSDLAAAKRKFKEVIETGAGQIGDLRQKMRAA